MIDVYKPGAARAVSLILHSSRTLPEKENIYTNLVSNLGKKKVRNKKVKNSGLLPREKKNVINTDTSVPVAARSKAWVCGRSPAEILGSNPAGGMGVCLL